MFMLFQVFRYVMINSYVTFKSAAADSMFVTLRIQATLTWNKQILYGEKVKNIF